MTLGMILIPVGDSIAKYISNHTDYSAHFLAWWRFLAGAIIIAPLAYTQTVRTDITTEFFAKQAVRAVLIVLTVVFIIKAVALSPVADVFGAFFIGPALSVVLSALLLKESPTLSEWLSVVLGFIGVLLVVQPAFIMALLPAPFFPAETNLVSDANDAGIYWALIAGIFYGSFLVATRWAAKSGPALAQVAMQFALASLLLTPFAVVELISSTLEQLDWLIIMGVTSVLANYCSVIAMRHLSAPALAPVVYMQVVAATFIGLFVFKEALAPLAALGILLIVVSGLFRIKRLR